MLKFGVRRSLARQPKETNKRSVEAALLQDKINRRMSTSFLQNLLLKQHLGEGKDEVGGGEGGKEASEDKAEPATPSPPPTASVTLPLEPLALPSKEQCACVSQLMQYIHGLVVITTQQSTDLERLRCQVTEAETKMSVLYLENERSPVDRKHGGYHHDKQLEELRNLQEAIQAEKEKVEKSREKQTGYMDSEREELRREKEEIEKEKTEMRSHKEELKRQKDTLQRQRDLFEEYKAQFSLNQQQERGSPHHVAPPGGFQRERSESPASRGVSPAARANLSQSSLLDHIHHKRSSSDDFQNRDRQGSPFEGGAAADSGRERSRQESGSGKLSSNHSFVSLAAGGTSGSRRDNAIQMPIHLLSATNEQKLGQIGQQLNYKLAQSGIGGGGGGGGGSHSGSGSSPTNPGSGSGSAASSAGSASGSSAAAAASSAATSHSQLARKHSASGIQQMLPLKLSSGGGGGGGNQGGGASPKVGPAFTRQPSPGSVSYTGPAAATASNATAGAGSSPTNAAVAKQPSSGGGGAKTLPGMGRTGSSSRLAGATIPGNILPMKLAEGGKQRPKSASAASAPSSGKGAKDSQHSRSKSSTAKKEPEIIYF